jgi:hypothetical protein
VCTRSDPEASQKKKTFSCDIISKVGKDDIFIQQSEIEGLDEIGVVNFIMSKKNRIIENKIFPY